MPKYQSILSYDSDQIKQFESLDTDEILHHVDPHKSNWITMIGLEKSDKAQVAQIIQYFGLESKIVQQIFDADHLEFEGEYDSCLYAELDVLAKYPLSETYKPVRTSFVLGDQFLLVFSEQRIGFFERLNQKILEGKTKIQQFGPDYLLYLLIKAAFIDNYHQIFREFIGVLESLEDEVLSNSQLDNVYKDVIAVRARIKPFYQYLAQLSDFIYVLRDGKSRFMGDNSFYLFTRRLDRDAEDLLQEYQRFRNWINELLDIHRSKVNESSNKVIKILTVFSTIFFPITFITGVYSMRFEYMPEITLRWGYPIALGVMLLLAVGELLYLRKKKWM